MITIVTWCTQASESQVSSKESGSTPSFKLAATSLTRPAQRQGNFINSQRNINAPAKSRISYSLGQGNRHHKKLLEMMSGEGNDSDRHLDTVRMTMMRVIKQSETWSKSSDVSTNGNDSTRNTTLCVGGLEQQYYRRKSESTEDDVSVSSNMLGDNLDAFLRLQLMNLSMATKRNSQVSSGGTAFQQFSLLSIRPSTFAVEELHDNGYRYLDPFSTKCIDLTDQYPSSSSESDVDTEALAAFCFPNGLRVRMIPRCAEEGARRIGWLGRNGDNYQLQGVSASVPCMIQYASSTRISTRNTFMSLQLSSSLMLLALSAMVLQSLLTKKLSRLTLPDFHPTLHFGENGEDLRLFLRVGGDRY